MTPEQIVRHAERKPHHKWTPEEIQAYNIHWARNKPRQPASADTAPHTRDQIAKDAGKRDRLHDLEPLQDEFCEAVEGIHGAAWFVLAALICAAVALVWGVTG
ncbi:hypothetical protein [Roseicyclus sp.]|uniref:hypothetical protein n=1 Tax=Roseicyclus sp. TaxID=1914329 RepID=UPI003F6D83CA